MTGDVVLLSIQRVSDGQLLTAPARSFLQPGRNHTVKRRADVGILNLKVQHIQWIELLSSSRPDTGKLAAVNNLRALEQTGESARINKNRHIGALLHVLRIVVTDHQTRGCAFQVRPDQFVKRVRVPKGCYRYKSRKRNRSVRGLQAPAFFRAYGYHEVSLPLPTAAYHKAGSDSLMR